jgi:adhesin/invasin
MIILLCASALAVSCGSKGGGSGEDTNTAAIALSINPTVLPADGSSSATVTADLTDRSGTAVPQDTSVTFSTTRGSFTNGKTTQTVKTPNESGSVSVSLIAGTITGNADVVAKSNKVTQKANLEFIDGPVGSVSVTLGAESIVADGTSKVLVTATVLDTNDNSVPDGTTVNFTATAGDFDTSAGGMQRTFSSTTTSGVATATLTSPVNVGTATIYAEAQGVTGTTTVGFLPGPVASIILGATPKTLAADGSSTSTITAFVTDANGNAVENEVINFQLTPRLGSLSAPIGTTTGGVATVTYTANTTAGKERVRAISANGVSAQVMLTLTDSSLVPKKISLSTSQISVKSDNSDGATITATVLDAFNAVVEGITVSFSSTGGQLSAASVDTDANGQAQVTFSSGITDPANQVVTITARVPDLEPAQIPIQIVGSTLTLSTDRTQITSDGLTSAILTATAKDAGGTTVFNTPVTWTLGGTGNGSVMLSTFVIENNTRIGFADTNPDTITRSDTGSFISDGFESGDQIRVQGSGQNDGSYIIQSVEATRLILVSSDTLNSEASGASVTITRGMSPPFAVNTDVSGEAKVLVTGTEDGSVTVFADGLGETAAQGYTVSPPGTEFFRISDPAQDPAHLSIGEELTITVTAPAPTTSVVFVATFGTWDGGTTSVVSKSVAGGSVSAVFSSTLAGVASIQVYDEDNPSESDSMQIVVSAAIEDAAHISLQSNTYVVPLSTGGNSYTATLTASVRTSFASGRQPVGGASVAFSIDNQTGGGETVFPATVFTDDSGVATTTFTSGSLSSGAEGVEITATVLGQGATDALTTISFNDVNPATITRSDAGSFVTDDFQAGEQIRVQGSASNDGDYTIASVSSKTLTLDSNDSLTAEPAGSNVTITAVTTSINIVVGGTSGSIVIGRGSQIEVLSPTTYSLPMSVLVADSNGNPQSGAVVSLSAWPEFYSTGNWVRRVETDIDPETGFITTEVLDICDLDITGTYPNEDANENLFLDPGEDTGNDPGHGDGQLTPPNSAAGTIPMTVTTEANGVANFDLVYMKSSAMWIIDRIRASTVVLGTETTSSMSFRLPAEKGEAEGCELPDSPYNPPTGSLDVDNINLTASPSNLTADGSSVSTITAVVTDVNGNGIDGEVISFEVTTGTGTLSAQKATTSGGIATVTYTASTTPGTETITASADNGVTDTVNITLIEGMVGSVSVTAGSDSIVANGTSQVLIMATVLDQNGRNVADGTAVTFTTTAGSISNVSSTINGVARATLTSSTNVGTATIEATAGGIIDRTTVNFIAGAVGNLQLTATPNNLTADGASTSEIRGLVTDANGNVVNDETVSFTITSGGGVLDANTAETDGGGGVAIVNYTASMTPGTVTVRAETTNGTSATVNIVLIEASVGSVTCGAGCDQIEVGGGTPVLISATVLDTSGNPVPDGTVVSFTTTAGTLSNITTTINGVATATLTSSNNVGTANVKITAGGVCCDVSVKFIPGPVATLSLTATDEVLPADGESQSTIRAFATDALGNGVDGETISFTLNSIGTLSKSKEVTNGGGGVAEVTYTAGTTAGTDTITAESTNGQTASIVIRLQPTAENGIMTLTANPTSIVADGVSTSILTANLKDRNGDPIAEVPVDFASQDPAISLPSDNTWTGEGPNKENTPFHSNGGHTTFTFFHSGILSSPFTVYYCKYDKTLDNRDERFTTDECKPLISRNGAVSNVTEELTLDPGDYYLNVAEADRAWSIEVDGDIEQIEFDEEKIEVVNTDASGNAQATYTSDTSKGVVTIWARSGDLSKSVGITQTAGSADKITLSVKDDEDNPTTSIYANGENLVKLAATVLDANNNPVEDGITVNFSATSGTLGTATAETSGGSGVATTTLTAIASSATVTSTITATVGALTDTTNVDFVGITLALAATETSGKLANGTESYEVIAQILDVSGQPVSDESVTFSGTGNTGLLTISPATSTTDSDGKTTCSVTDISSVTDTVTISATTGTLASLNSIGLAFTGTGGGGVPVGSVILAATETTGKQANGIDSYTVTAQVLDPSNQPMNNQPVVFSVTGNTGLVAMNPPVATTAQDGTAITEVTDISNISDTVYISASSGGVRSVVTSPAADPGNAGNGSMSEVTVDPVNTLTEDWTVVCTAAVPDGGIFSVTGSVSGLQVATATVGAAYTSDGGEVSFTITDGSSDFQIGDSFTFSTTAPMRLDFAVPAGPGVPASLGLSTSQISVKSDNSDSATITATVLDVDNAVVEGIVVEFSADGGQISASSAQTDENGQAQVAFSSGTVEQSNRVVTITAKVSGLPDAQIPIQVVGSTLKLNSDKNVITNDGSTTATLTVVAKDASGTPVYNTPISFTSSGAGSVTFTPPSGNTDINGELDVTVTGTSAGDVTVTAQGLGATATQEYEVIPAGAVFFQIIQPQSDPISWTTVDPGPVAIIGPSTQIAFVDSDPDTIVRSDGGDFAADGFNMGDRIMVGGSTSNDTDAGAGTPAYYTVAAVSAGSLTLIPSDTLIAEAAGSSVTVTNGILVTVEAPPPTTEVNFATTFGAWDGTGSAVVKKSVIGGFVSAVFSSSLAGVASIQVSADDDPTSFDSLQAVVSAPTADAAHITLQSNTYVVPLSTGNISNTATLTASVRTSSATGRQPVGGAPVVFSIENQTGGGETIFPVIVHTDASGTATTTFTSGSLSSSAEGVTITARVLDQASTGPSNQIEFVNSNPDTIVRLDGGDFGPGGDGYEAGEQIQVQGSASNDGSYIVDSVAASTLTLDPGDTLTNESAGNNVTITAVTSSINIVVGGTAGSLVIGRGSEITVLSPTTYSLPMSVLVADSNGNPVPGTTVSLNAWPIEYSTGEWVEIIILSSQYCEANITGTFPNEDINENLFLDPGEDTGPHPGHGDGQLTPPNSAAGTVPMTVTTDANGVANFDLVYMKSSAVWIVDRIEASTLVLGTEATSSMTFRLPFERSEGFLCELPDSPYNKELPVDFINLTADPNNLTADGESISTIRAQVYDSNGLAIEGEVVSFEVTTGSGRLSVPTAITDDQGVAQVIYTAATTPGTETVTATTANGTSASVDIELIEADVNSITCTAGCDSIVAGGGTRVKISGIILDDNGKGVPDGTNVTFTTTAGDIDDTTPGTQTTFVTTTDDGEAIAMLASPDKVGTATISITAGGVCCELSVEFVAGPVANISLAATPNNLTADGASTSTIRAMVTDANGNAVDDETITFAITTGTGRLSSPTAITSNGIAVIGYTASTVVGTETIRADVTNGAAFDTVDIDLIDVVIGTVVTTAGSEEVIADGASQTLIEALVQDNNDNNVADGTVVTFATTAGTLSGVTTTTNGVATALLTSPTNLGVATITATAGGVSDTTTVTFIAGGANSISLTAAPSNLTADGSSLSTIRAYVTDASGNPTSNETITFTVTTGTGTLSSQTASTINGVANVVYTASDVVGPETIRAEATNPAVFDTVNITLINVVVGQVSVTAGSPTAIADGASQTLIAATVQDNNGNNVADGTVVNFTTTAGTLSGITTTTNGVATAWLTSPTNVGTATVTATAGGVTNNTFVSFIAGPANTISLTATPNNLTADGTSTSTIRAYVTDANGNATNGDTITFTITTGTGTLESQTAITENGVATVTYMASDVVGTETIRAEATDSAVFDTVDIDLIDAVVGSVTVTAGNDTAVADGLSETLILATVEDQNGNNVADGTVVTFTTTAGTLSGITTTTNGVASATLTSPTNVGVATVIATAGGVSGSVTVTFVPSAVNAISLSATPNNLTADGTSTSTIRAFVTDVDNNAVEGEVITFRVTSGTGVLSAATATTAAGVATVTYTASSTPGTETITAESTNGVSTTVNIALIGAQIASIELTANPSSLPADGASESTISATVTLVGGGEAPDGTTVSFSVVSEPAFTLVPSNITPTASTAAGVATAFLTSSDGVGTATIRAEAGGRKAELQIEYTPGSLTLTIVPNSLLGTGEATANVTAVLKDVTGSPPPAGETVVFTLDDLSLGTITPSALSDVNGEAVAVFQDAAEGGTVTVTGTWTTGGVDVVGSATIDIAAPPAFIENAEDSPDPASINIKGTGGKSTSLITFDVKDVGGNLVTDGYRIDFSLESGPNGGEKIRPLSAMTADGQVSTILSSGFKAGPVSIRAVYHNDVSVSTTTTQIAISGGPPVGEEFGISADYLNISGLWIANLQDEILVNAGDIYGNAIPDNTAISFKTYNTGGFFTPNTATTEDGLATNILRSGGTYLEPLEGFVSVTAEAINGGRTTHVTSLAVAPAPDNNVIYAGTDGGGVYKSIDYGATWVNVSRSSENAKQGQNWMDPYVKGNSAICVDPDDHNIVYVGTGYLGSGNIYRSLDGGMNWNSNNVEEWNGIFNTVEAVLTVVCDGDATATDYPYIWAGTEGLGAVFAPDGETFQWGGKVDPVAPTTEPSSGIYTNPTNTGNGAMTEPSLGASSKTETWTATYEVAGATASTPTFIDVSGAGADGSMTGVSASDTASTETWTATYTGGVSIGYNTPTPLGPGFITVLSTSATTFNETWTVTCVDDSTPGSEMFSVVGTVSGINPQATANVNYFTGNQEMTFVITGSGFNGPATPGPDDTIPIITTRDGWSVAGTVSGAMANVARTDTAYTSDNGEVGFTINPGFNRFYQTGDVWTFTTSVTGDWELVGFDDADNDGVLDPGEQLVSGYQVKRARTNQLYTSDNYEVTFIISSGTTPFDIGDVFTFDVTESGLGYGKVVRDMAKVSGTHGSGAELYAGTNTGIFRTTNGGLTWHDFVDANSNDVQDPGESGFSFTGDFITAVALHPSISNVLYAGTEDAGVWVGTLSGPTWTWNASPYITGMGEGLSATTPMADPNNVGNGVMSAVSVSSTTQSEIWSVTCTAEAPNSGTFSVTGSISGPQVGTATVGAPYTSDGGEVSFTISDGSTDFKIGDSFTFSTTRDPGRTIRDVLVDPANDKLYAITYFWGPLEPHAVGNVYVIDIDSVTGLPSGNWSEANAGLPEYDPPDDTTLFAQHVMAADPPTSPTALYIGGEGINFYKATSGLATGTPAWFSSKSGLTNLIMARMPILFTDRCFMSILTERDGNIVTFTVYIEDVNGNPPIEGSTFFAEWVPEVGDSVTLANITYPDTYVHQGTFRDPADPSTNWPYVYVVDVSVGGKVIFTFTPRCVDGVPGCSGSVQEETYLY